MNSKSGFTLVELVVVIMILGILAGVAAPSMINTSGAATDNGIRQTLSIVRDAIELYTADPVVNPSGNPPAFADSATFQGLLSRYIRGTFPNCPVGAGAGTNTVVEVDELTASTDATGPWRYDADTGEFRVNFAGATNILPGVNYDAL